MSIELDQLGNRPTDGFGAGAWTINPALYSQYYFWTPNRRIVRVRFDASDAFSRPVTIQNASVYGTSAGFRGTAHPASSLYLDAAAEYSATRSWVLALDATYRNTGNTRVTGSYSGAPITQPTRSPAKSRSRWKPRAIWSPARRRRRAPCW